MYGSFAIVIINPSIIAKVRGSLIVIVVPIVGFVSSLITGGGRVSTEDEQIGLDETTHGEKAMNL